MSALLGKRSVMTLYSGSSDIDSHRSRIVLAEKGVVVDILYLENNKKNESLVEINPYNTVPTLVDRDLVLYDVKIIMEYLDERFPHPPLLPVYPVARAKSRLMMFRIEKDWYTLFDKIKSARATTNTDVLIAQLRDSIVGLTPIFKGSENFLSDDFSLLDCCLAPLFWRLPSIGIELKQCGKVILDYSQRLFERDSFQSSLTEEEREFYL